MSVKQVRYIGQDNRVLIDVGTLSYGDTFTATDDFADRLIATLPESYELVVDEAPKDEAPKDEAPSKTSKKSTSTTTTDTESAEEVSD